MRILHTSDWHAGRIFKSVDRLDELEVVLDQMARFVASEKVELVLISGDLFDTGSPPAKAERAVFRFLRRVGDAGAQTALIAGNHDSASRIEAWGVLAELVGVHARGRPANAAQGGVLRVKTAKEHAIVAAVPFAHARQLVSALELMDEERALNSYAERMQRVVKGLTREFSADAVNLVLAHTHLHGAELTGSERKVSVGEAWAVMPQALPAQAHYVALGHIHKPQEVKSAPSPAFYAGSPLQLDFGEAGEAKSFNFIEAVAGKPARVEAVPYEGAKPLVRLRLGLAEVEARAEALRGAGWLELTVPLEAPDPETNRRVRTLLPNALAVHVELPVQKQVERPSMIGATPRQIYASYYLAEHGAPLPDALGEAFDALYAEVGGET